MCLGTMASADIFHGKLYFMFFVKTTISHVRETSSYEGIVFPSYTYFIYTDHSEWLFDFDLFYSLSIAIWFIWSFCSSGQVFAADFF